jgi:hypothetical protein
MLSYHDLRAGIWDENGQEEEYMPPKTTPSYFEMTCDDDVLIVSFKHASRLVDTCQYRCLGWSAGHTRCGEARQYVHTRWS